MEGISRHNLQKSFASFFVLHPPEPCSNSKDDNDDLPLDNEKEEQHVADYVVLLKKSSKANSS